MKYPASKHYSHLDPSEPIPQIEPRCNQHFRVAYEAVSKVMVWMLLGLVGVHLLIYALVPSYLIARIVGMAVSLVFLGAVVRLIAQAQRRAGLKRQDAKKSKDDQWGIPVGLQMRYFVFFMLFMFTMQGGLVFRKGLLSGLFMLGIYVFFTGFALILVARFVRQPGQISCERCDYPLTGLTLPTGCPECGHAILDLSYATDRPRVRDARILVVGIVLVVLAGSLGVLHIASPQTLYAPMPRAVLLRMAPTDRDAFNQLMKSPASPEQEQQLIHSMVSARTGFSTGSSYEQQAWFGAKIMQGALGGDELDGLFMPATQSRIKAPSTARVGEPVRLLIEADYRPSPSGTAVMYYLEGYRIGDAPTPHAGSTAARYRDFLSSPEDPEYIDKGYVPMHTWTPTEPGEVIIRARLVFVLAPGTGTRVRIDWSAQGDARFPAPPLWTHEIELTHTITVLE